MILMMKGGGEVSSSDSRLFFGVCRGSFAASLIRQRSLLEIGISRLPSQRSVVYGYVIPINRSQTHSIANTPVSHLQHTNNLSLIYCIITAIGAERFQKRLSISSSLSVYSK